MISYIHGEGYDYISVEHAMSMRDPSEKSMDLVMELQDDLDLYKESLAFNAKKFEVLDLKCPIISRKNKSIELRAIEVFELNQKRLEQREILNLTYHVWKMERAFFWIDEGTPTYERMILDAQPAIERLRKLDQKVKNAQKRLNNAIDRLLKVQTGHSPKLPNDHRKVESSPSI